MSIGYNSHQLWDQSTHQSQQQNQQTTSPVGSSHEYTKDPCMERPSLNSPTDDLGGYCGYHNSNNVQPPTPNSATQELTAQNLTSHMFHQQQSEDYKFPPRLLSDDCFTHEIDATLNLVNQAASLNAGQHSSEQVDINNIGHNNTTIDDRDKQVSPQGGSYSQPGDSHSDSSSSKNDKELTEHELNQRRKAQNRAAQRAFRERKEGKLKELSSKLNQSESERQKLLEQLEHLTKQNLLLDMENKLLHKSGNNINHNSGERVDGDAFVSENNDTKNTNHKSRKFDFPRNREEFITGIVSDISSIDGEAIRAELSSNSNDVDMNDSNNDCLHQHNFVSLNDHEPIQLHGLTFRSQKYNTNNTEVLTVSAVWDYLNEISMINEDLELDIPAVMEKLRGAEMCHGRGPAYSLELVNKVIKECVRSV